MPGIEELLQLAQGGGGGAPPTQQGPPQGGGGGGMAQALQAKLAELMQDPVAMKGMQQYMQQMGGGGMPGGAAPAPPQGPMDMPPQGMAPGMEAPPGAPQPGDAEAMAKGAIDGAGDWEGTDEPSQADIERLASDPSQANIDSFNQQFGEGAAEEALSSEEQSEKGPPPKADDEEGDAY